MRSGLASHSQPDQGLFSFTINASSGDAKSLKALSLVSWMTFLNLHRYISFWKCPGLVGAHRCGCMCNVLTVLFRGVSSSNRCSFKLSRCARLMKRTELQMLCKLLNPHSSCSCLVRCVWGLCRLMLHTDGGKVRPGGIRRQNLAPDLTNTWSKFVSSSRTKIHVFISNSQLIFIPHQEILSPLVLIAAKASKKTVKHFS